MELISLKCVPIVETITSFNLIAESLSFILLRLLQFVWRGWEESKQRFSPFPRVATPCNSRISAGPCPACSSCS